MKPSPPAPSDPYRPGPALAAEGLLEGLPWGVLVLDEQAIIQRANPAVAQWCGLPASLLPGRALTDAALPPALRAALLPLLEELAGAACEVFLPELAQWVAFSATRQPGGWVLYGHDITAQKEGEAELRATERRRAYLRQLRDALRPLHDPAAIQATAARLLGQQLAVDRAYYVEVDAAAQEFVVASDWHRPGAPSHAGRYPVASWRMPWLLNGQTWVAHDVDTDPTLPDEQRADYRATDIRATVVVPLVRHGQLVATLVANQSTPRAWTAHEVALVEGTAERTWAAVLPARAEEALLASEEKYRTLFTAMDEGFAMLELLPDNEGQPVDFVYRKANPAFVRNLGLDVLGQRHSEIFAQENQAFLLEKLMAVATSGQPQHFEFEMQSLGGQWFQTTAVRVGGAESRLVGMVFRNTTKRKRREANLAFLAELNVDFAPSLNAEQIMARVSERLASYLGLSRFHLAMVDAEADRLRILFDWRRAPEQLPPLPGTDPIADYLTPAGRQHVAAGRPLVLDGEAPSPLISTPLAALARMGFGSSVDIPHLIDGQWRFLLTVARAAPGPWRPDEVDLLRQLAAHVYARLERAQAEAALQEAHGRLVGALESTHDAFYALDAEFRFTYVNQRAAQLWGRAPGTFIGQTCWQEFPQTVSRETSRRYHEVLKSGQPAHFETISPILGIWIEVSIYPSLGGGLVVFFRDIAGRKRAEERQAYLLQLSDALRPLQDPAEIQAAAVRVLGEHFGADRAQYWEVEPNEEYLVGVSGYAKNGVARGERVRLADFGPYLRAAIAAGQPFSMDDAATDPRVGPAELAAHEAAGARSYLAIPLQKQGRLVAALGVYRDQAHQWTTQEMALAEETAERTWAAVERSRAEQARHQSEQRLRAVMENLPGAAVFIVGPSLRYQLAEGEALRQAGYEPADFVGRPVQELCPPGLWSDYQRCYEQALAGQSFEYEHQQNGRTYATKGGPLRDAEGAVVSVLAVSYDITARQQAEEAVRRSEEQFRLFVTTSTDTLYRMSPDWRQMLTLDGKNFLADTADPSGSWVEKYIPLEDQVVAWATIHAAIASQEPFELEHRVYGADGAVAWTYSRAVPVFDAGGEIVEWFGAATNITARKQAEEALRLSEQRLSLALQAGRMGSFEWTSDSHRVSLSAMSAEVLGLVPGTTLATNDEAVARLIHTDDLARHQAIFSEAARTGQDFHSIFRIVRPLDGEVRWIEERGQGTHDPATGGVRLRGVHWDVTETMLAQQRLAEFTNTLEQRVARRTRDLQASRDLLQSVFDTNLIAMSVQEAVRDETGAIRDFRLRLVSRELERDTGRTDLVGKLYAEEYPGIRETGIFDLAVKAVETGQPQGMEYYYHYEGFDRWYVCQFVKLDDGIVATNLDITERKTAEQERMKNLRLLEQAEAVAGLGSWDYELATKILRWSDGMYHLYGLPPGSAVEPANYLRMVVPNDQPVAEQLVQRLATGAGDFEKTLCLRVDGQVKTVRMKAMVFHDEQGQAVRVLGVDLDISELQRLEQDNLRLRLRQQRALFEAVQAAQETERKRMAESLHNGIGQILYATKLHLDRLHAPLLGTDATLVGARREADLLLSEAIRQTRALSHELVPMVLSEFGLSAALQDICRTMSSPTLRFHCLLLLDEHAAPLGPTLQMAIYRMAQELAQNTARHARGATEASLELETMPGWVLLRAEDNGPGFAEPPAEAPGLGLRSIRDRVALLGGQLEMGAAPAGGAYVRIRIPLPAPAPL